MPDSKKNRWPASGFGDRLRTLREQRGLTQEQLARKADISSLTVSRLERGKQEPFWPVALVLARELGVSVADFVPQKGAGEED